MPYNTFVTGVELIFWCLLRPQFRGCKKKKLWRGCMIFDVEKLQEKKWGLQFFCGEVAWFFCWVAAWFYWRGCAIFFNKRLHDFCLLRGCMIFVWRGCVIFLNHSLTQPEWFFLRRGCVIFLLRDCVIFCVKRLLDFLCEEVAWFFCEEVF